MWSEIVYRYKIANLRRGITRIQKAFDKDIKAAHAAKKSAEEIYRIQDSEQFEVRTEEEIIKTVQSRHFKAEADRLLIDTEPYNGRWQKGELCGPYLYSSALEELSRAVRKEKKERREAALVFVPAMSGAIGSITGLIGVIIALVSLYKK